MRIWIFLSAYAFYTCSYKFRTLGVIDPTSMALMDSSCRHFHSLEGSFLGISFRIQGGGDGASQPRIGIYVKRVICNCSCLRMRGWSIMRAVRCNRLSNFDYLLLRLDGRALQLVGARMGPLWAVFNCSQLLSICCVSVVSIFQHRPREPHGVSMTVTFAAPPLPLLCFHPLHSQRANPPCIQASQCLPLIKLMAIITKNTRSASLPNSIKISKSFRVDLKKPLSNRDEAVKLIKTK